MFFLDFCFCFACDAAYENTCRTESEPACGRVAEWRGGQGQGGVVGGSHVCGKPCKQRFKMIKCFRSRSCVGRVLSFRLSGLSRACFSGFAPFGCLGGGSRWPCKVSFSKNPQPTHIHLHTRIRTQRYLSAQAAPKMVQQNLAFSVWSCFLSGGRNLISICFVCCGSCCRFLLMCKF